MTKTLAISKTILTQNDLHSKFGLSVSADPQFFTEWHQNLPELTAHELEMVEHLQQRFTAHRYKNTLAEGAVDKLLISPLLDLAGLYEPEFEIRTEEPVQFAVEDEDELIKGRIDTLIVRDRLWVLVVEAKRTLVLEPAVPQALSYMVCSPTQNQPLYGMVSNGDDFIFLKMQFESAPKYSTSKSYSLIYPPSSQDLFEVFRVLKQIKGTIA
jgi:hypothetical protein